MSVERLPSTGATSIPPRTRQVGAYTGAGGSDREHRAGTYREASLWGLTWSSTRPRAAAPVTATVVSTWNRSAQPVSVVSRPAAPASLPTSAIGPAQRGLVERAGARYAEMRPADAAAVLHRGQRSGVDDLDHATPPREPHPVTGRQQRRRSRGRRRTGPRRCGRSAASRPATRSGRCRSTRRRARRCPAGTCVRGVACRGTARLGGSPVRYAKPGAKPQNATRNSVRVCDGDRSAALIRQAAATSSRSGPSYHVGIVISSPSASAAACRRGPAAASSREPRSVSVTPSSRIVRAPGTISSTRELAGGRRRTSSARHASTVGAASDAR